MLSLVTKNLTVVELKQLIKKYEKNANIKGKKSQLQKAFKYVYFKNIYPSSQTATVTVEDVSTVSTLNSQDENKHSTVRTPDTLNNMEVVTPSTEIVTNLSRDMGLEKSIVSPITLNLDNLKKTQDIQYS